jgi:hypothetical protein
MEYQQETYLLKMQTFLLAILAQTIVSLLVHHATNFTSLEWGQDAIVTILKASSMI